METLKKILNWTKNKIIGGAKAVINYAKRHPVFTTLMLVACPLLPLTGLLYTYTIVPSGVITPHAWWVSMLIFQTIIGFAQLCGHMVEWGVNKVGAAMNKDKKKEEK